MSHSTPTQSGFPPIRFLTALVGSLLFGAAAALAVGDALTSNDAAWRPIRENLLSEEVWDFFRTITVSLAMVGLAIALASLSRKSGGIMAPVGMILGLSGLGVVGVQTEAIIKLYTSSNSTPGAEHLTPPIMLVVVGLVVAMIGGGLFLMSRRRSNRTWTGSRLAVAAVSLIGIAVGATAPVVMARNHKQSEEQFQNDVRATVLAADSAAIDRLLVEIPENKLRPVNLILLDASRNDSADVRLTAIRGLSRVTVIGMSRLSTHQQREATNAELRMLDLIREDPEVRVRHLVAESLGLIPKPPIREFSKAEMDMGWVMNEFNQQMLKWNGRIAILKQVAEKDSDDGVRMAAKDSITKAEASKPYVPTQEPGKGKGGGGPGKGKGNGKGKGGDGDKQT